MYHLEPCQIHSNDFLIHYIIYTQCLFECTVMNSGTQITCCRPSSSQDGLCVDSNTPGAALPHVPCSGSGQTPADAPGSFTPSLAAHFDDNLIRHIQGWPSENIEKQVKMGKKEKKVLIRTLTQVLLCCGSRPDT